MSEKTSIEEHLKHVEVDEKTGKVTIDLTAMAKEQQRNDQSLEPTEGAQEEQK